MNYNFAYNSHEGRWVGMCPRCGRDSFFEQKSSIKVSNNNNHVEVLYCPGTHAIMVECIYYPNGEKTLINLFPKEFTGKIPNWLPDSYKSIYSELLKAKTLNMNRSVVSLCSILLEKYVNTFIKNPGEKKHTLYKKLEILFETGKIDKDQFSNATLTRLQRNDTLHPDEDSQDVPNNEAEEIFEEITGFFERSFKWRSSKALPPPEV